MNVNDTEILNAIMTNTGYERTTNIEEANIVFLVTVGFKRLKQKVGSISFIHSVLFEIMQKLEFGNDSSILDITRLN